MKIRQHPLWMLDMKNAKIIWQRKSVSWVVRVMTCSNEWESGLQHEHIPSLHTCEDNSQCAYFLSLCCRCAHSRSACPRQHPSVACYLHHPSKKVRHNFDRNDTENHQQTDHLHQLQHLYHILGVAAEASSTGLLWAAQTEIVAILLVRMFLPTWDYFCICQSKDKLDECEKNDQWRLERR